LQLHIAGIGNDQNWLRPSTWGYLEIFSPTGVDEKEVAVPLKTELYANYPNPFNPATNIKFDLKKNAHVSLVVYNMLGQQIKTLVNSPKLSGHHAIHWDGTNDQGAKVTSGIYFYQFKADGYTKTNKMILMK